MAQTAGLQCILYTVDSARVIFIYFNDLLRENLSQLEMWANAQRDGRPAEHTWRPLFNAAKFG